MKKRQMQFQIKELSEAGYFEGLLSPYGNVDQGGDVVEPGAYNKTLKDHGYERPLLWQHKTDCPIGKLVLEDRQDGLWCKGQLLMELPLAQQAYSLIKAKIVQGLSIGFESVKDAIEGGVRHLKEIRLWEGSIVTFGMNLSALITSVKAARETKDDFNAELADIQLFDAGYQMHGALNRALSSLFYAGLTKDEMVTGAQSIIQQFSEAYMAYLPAYIDAMTEMYGGMEMWEAHQHETKAGAVISSANADKIKSACEQIKGGHDSLLTLVETKAGIATLEAQAVEQEPKPEPEVDHSAFKSLIDQIDQIKGLVPA
jgi:HK97 family phage prohead protease